ncbi:MAG: SPFH domain-containing protein, partial [Draconibacterium sp.]
MKFNFKSSYLVIAVIGLIVILLFGGRMFMIIEPGERGVIFRPYTSGLDKDNIYTEGFHVIAPWNDMKVYNVREQQREETMDVLDKNGLSINTDVTVRFNPHYTKIGHLHEK